MQMNVLLKKEKRKGTRSQKGIQTSEDKMNELRSPSGRKREILSFEYCTHYSGLKEVCAVESYALVKLNKGKVFPNEGQKWISEWECKEYCKS